MEHSFGRNVSDSHLDIDIRKMTYQLHCLTGGLERNHTRTRTDRESETASHARHFLRACHWDRYAREEPQKTSPVLLFFGEFDLRDVSRLYINQWLCPYTCSYPSWCDLLLASFLAASS